MFDFKFSLILFLNLIFIYSLSNPWFRSAAIQLLSQLKKIQPTEIEMMFCLGIMFWKLTCMFF